MATDKNPTAPLKGFFPLYAKRQRGDSNPCGQSPMDFESISLTARTHCHMFTENVGLSWARSLPHRRGRPLHSGGSSARKSIRKNLAASQVFPAGHAPLYESKRWNKLSKQSARECIGARQNDTCGI